MKFLRSLKTHSNASLATTILASLLWLSMPSPTANASTVTLFQQWVNLSNAPGFSVSGQYLAKFGGFTNNFQPTLENLASWDANFSGGTGTYDMATKSPYVQFNNTNNSLVADGQPLWLIVYNVTAAAQASSATAGVVLRMDQWVAGSAIKQITVGRRTDDYTINYDYWAGGTRWIRAGTNFSEDNFTGPQDIQKFTSPTHNLALGTGNLAGYDIVITSAITASVPEPTSALLGGIGFVLLLRRRRIC